MARGHRRGRDPIHPAALEPPHRSQGEQFLGVDARARVSVTSPPSKFYIIGGADNGRMLLLPRGTPRISLLVIYIYTSFTSILHR